MQCNVAVNACCLINACMCVRVVCGGLSNQLIFSNCPRRQPRRLSAPCLNTNSICDCTDLFLLVGRSVQCGCGVHSTLRSRSRAAAAQPLIPSILSSMSSLTQREAVSIVVRCCIAQLEHFGM